MGLVVTVIGVVVGALVLAIQIPITASATTTLTMDPMSNAGWGRCGGGRGNTDGSGGGRGDSGRQHAALVLLAAAFCFCVCPNAVPFRSLPLGLGAFLLRLGLALAPLLVGAASGFDFRFTPLLRLRFALTAFCLRRLQPRFLIGAAFRFDLPASAFGLGQPLRRGFLLLLALLRRNPGAA